MISGHSGYTKGYNLTNVFSIFPKQILKHEKFNYYSYFVFLDFFRL